MKFRLLVAVLFLSASVLRADSTGAPNLKEPRANILTAGQPTEAELKTLVDLGTKVVINLRPHDEPEARDETGELEKLGIPYFNIPITPDTITPEKLRQFACILKENRDVPVLIHCASGNRVGGLWLLYRVFSENSDAESALAEARTIGMKPSLEPVVLKLMDDYRADPPELTCP
jgi:uncharacterized protein (TIGR01244 family)